MKRIDFWPLCTEARSQRHSKPTARQAEGPEAESRLTAEGELLSELCRDDDVVVGSSGDMPSQGPASTRVRCKGIWQGQIGEIP